MNYYIATSIFRNKEHNLVRDGLKAFCHEINYDWTSHGSVKSESKERLKEIGILMLNAISEADFVVVLLPGRTGTHLELGFALASGKKVFLHTVDPTLFELGPQTNAFYYHPDVTRLTCPLSDVAATVHSALDVYQLNRGN